MVKKLTNSIFIEKSILKHGDNYDYSKVEYTHSKQNVIIICSIHGDFLQTPNRHMKGNGCKLCGRNKLKSNTYDFIKNSIIKHGDKYDYSKVNYINSKKKVIIICKIHGEFKQSPNHHLCGSTCNLCSNVSTGLKIRLTNTKFINKAKIIHGDKYDYSKVNYINTYEKVIIICKLHGKFKQVPFVHLGGSNCQICTNKLSNTIEFIKKAKVVHNNIYDYSKVIYIHSKKNIIIICDKHGEFIQIPNNHLRGTLCPKCCNNNFSKSQILWLLFLEKYYNINIQHASNGGEYLIKNTNFKADGYCKENNTIYEYHGDYWHGNPNKFKQDDMNEVCNKTYKELYENTLKREKIIKDLGYNLVTIWESEWKILNKNIKIFQLKFRNKL